VPIGFRSRYSTRTRLRLTPAGWLFLLLTVFIGLAALQSQAALVFVLFGIMAGTLLVSGTLSKRMVSGLRVRRDMPGRVWQNQTVHLGYDLRNIRRSGTSLGLSVNEVAPPGVESAGGYCLQLPPRTTFRTAGRFAARKRGRLDLKGIHVATVFPFGLVSARRFVEIPRSLVVWPGLGKLKRRVLLSGAVEISTAAPSPATGGQDEFFGLREYREGDNPRWIHWRRSATRTLPVIREMTKPLPQILWIILDTYWPNRLRPANERREKFLRFAATLIEYALSRAYLVGLAVGYGAGTRVLPPGEGRAHRSALLDALADVDENTRTKLSGTLGALRRGQLTQAQVVLIAPDSTASRTDGLGDLRSECRSLTLVNERHLTELFQDDPLIEPEQIHAV